MADNPPQVAKNSKQNIAGDAATGAENLQEAPQKKRPPIRPMFWILCSMDAVYLAWIFCSLVAKVFSLGSFAAFGLFPLAGATSSYAFISSHVFALLLMICSFSAICHYGHTLLDYPVPRYFDPLSLLLPMAALCYLSGLGILYDLDRLAWPQREKPNESAYPVRQNLVVVLALTLQFALLFGFSGRWQQLGKGLYHSVLGFSSMQGIKDPQNPLNPYPLNPLESGSVNPQEVPKEMAEDPNSLSGTVPQGSRSYLPELIHDIDIWFLSLKGISAVLALLESSAVEVGAIVYGSISVGKILVPLRELLQRISDILFYGRVILTIMQIVQNFGHSYGTGILLLLLLLAALEYSLRVFRLCFYTTLGNIQIKQVSWVPVSSSVPEIIPEGASTAPPPKVTPAATPRYILSLFHPGKILLLLRFHLLLLLFLSWFFEPGLQLLDNIMEQVVLPEELRMPDQVLQELQQDYADVDIGQTSRRTWSKLLDSIQQWLLRLQAQFRDLGQRLLYFMIWAVVRTIVLPFAVLLSLFFLYKLLLSELLRLGRV